MFTCRICHFSTALDDVVLRHDTEQCICLACYARATGTARPMPPALQRALDAVLAEVQATEAGP